MIGRVDRSPLIAASVALVWLAGAMTGSHLLLGTAAVSGLILPACWPVRFREPSARRKLAIGLGGIAAAAAIFLLVLSSGIAKGPWIFILEVLALAAGSLAVPLLYAATFGTRS